MKNRREDVTRKVLILLYLATYSDTNDTDYFMADRYPDNDDAHFDEEMDERKWTVA